MNFKSWIINENMKFRGIYFHGTSSVFLNNILSDGLNPNSKNKVWDKDDDRSLSMSDRTSYGGIYISKQLRIALTSANNAIKKFKGKKLIVICELESRSLYADEDSIKVPDILNSNDYQNFSLYKAYRYPENESEINYLNKVKEKWIEEFIRINNFISMNENLIKRVQEILIKQGFFAKLTRNVSYYTDLYSWGNLFKNSQVPPLPSKSEAEIAYKEFIDKITKLKKISLSSDEEDVGYDRWNGRTLKPIRYSGSNRIICILEEVEKNKFKIHYGNVPDDFLNQYKSMYESLEFI